MKLVRVIFLLPAAALIMWAVRLLAKRGVLVRFGTFWHSRLGHMIGNTECYLCERDAGLQPKAFDIWFPDPAKDANPVISGKYRNLLHVWPAWLARPVFAVNGLDPRWQKHIVVTKQVDRDTLGLWEKHAPHIGFTEREERRGNSLLRSLGIPSGALFACLMVRDGSYLARRFPKADFSYHDYRDADISDYIPTAVELIRRGYYVVRMGAIVGKPLLAKHSMIIDYPARGRTAFGDLYLGAKCAFCVGTPAGFTAIPAVFNRPLALTDCVPLEYALTWGRGVMTWKHHEKEGRRLGVREICSSGLGLATFSQLFEQQRVKLVNNSAQEIYECAMECAIRTETGDWGGETQDAFWDNFPTSMVNGSSVNGVKRIRIGAEFLKGYAQ